MRNLAFAAYGLLAYAFFFVTVLYAIAFVGNMPGFKTLDQGRGDTPLLQALLIDLALLTVFALQHSVMGRPAFKRWWTRIVPAPVERSTYVLCASAALALLFWQWRPLPGVVWSLEGTTAGTLLQAVSWAGWGTVLGGFPWQVLEDNTEAWSGDHCVDFALVPGVLLSNKRIQAATPALTDVAPTILAEFAVEKPKNMAGRSVFESTSASLK